MKKLENYNTEFVTATMSAPFSILFTVPFFSLSVREPLILPKRFGKNKRKTVRTQ